MMVDTIKPSRLDHGRREQQRVFWFDLSDLFAFYPANKSVTGIERVEIMLFLGLLRQTGSAGDDEASQTKLRVCYFNPAAGAYCEAAPEYLAKRLEAFVHGRHRRASGLSKALISAIPKPLRPKRFFDIPLESAFDAPCAFRPGDVFTVLGAPWFHPSHVECITKVCEEYRMQLCILVHDLIPIRFPAWFPPAFVEEMKSLWDTLLNRADLLLANSKHTAEDVARYCGERSLRRHAPTILRFGDDLKIADAGRAGPRRGAAQYAKTGFVLAVGSISPRKNHALLLRVWERLYDTHGTKTPYLIVVGKFADPAHRTLFALTAGHRVVHLDDVSDVELADFYNACAFTIFPSLAEGWGLPVAESLARGKLCLASDRTAIPEVGGTMIDYFDPEDQDACYRLVERFFFDREVRLAAEQRILTGYQSTSWQETADTLLRVISDEFP